MSAYFDQGFSVREPSWHGLAEVLGEYPGREVAIEKAGHDFEIISGPIWTTVPGEASSTQRTLSRAKGWKALTASDNGDLLHVARATFGVIQPVVMWDVLDAIVGLPNVKYETAGTLKSRSVLWALAYLDEPTTISGDVSPIYPFISVSMALDGSGALKAQNQSVRTICWNTFKMAEVEARQSGREFTFRHTANVMEKIEDAKMALSGVRADHLAFIELGEELAALPVSDRGVDFFINQFIPSPPETLISDRVVKNVDEARAVVRSIIGGKTIEQSRGSYSAWDLLQTGTEYLDHLRGYRNKETLLGRQLLRPEPLKTRLVPLVREAASV